MNDWRQWHAGKGQAAGKLQYPLNLQFPLYPLYAVATDIIQARILGKKVHLRGAGYSKVMPKIFAFAIACALSSFSYF